MDDLDVLARDFGYRPQGKSAPMRSSDAADRRSSAVRSYADDRDGLIFNDVFGGPPKFTTTSNAKSSSLNDFDYESIFKTNNNNNNNSSSKTSSLPVYDKPVYDDDIFEGLPGLKSKSVSASASASASTMRFEENVFASMPTSPPKQKRGDADHQFDDLLGSLGRNEREGKNTRNSSSRGVEDLLSDFGSGRTTSESHQPAKPVSPVDDPFVVLESTSTPASSSSGVFSDPLEEISKLGKSGGKMSDASLVSGGVFDDLDPLNGFGNSIPPFPPEKGGREDRSPTRLGPSISATQSSTDREHSERYSFRYSESQPKKAPVDDFQESPLFDMPSVSSDSKKSFSQSVSSPPPYSSASVSEKNFQADVSPRSEGQATSADDIWLTVSEIPLFTQPTKAPPPSRPPPPIPRRTLKAESGYMSSSARKKGDEYSPSYSSYSESPKPTRPGGKNPPTSQIDELEDFVTGRTINSFADNGNVHSSEDMDAAAAAMKEAMDRAEAKFRHAKEVREREYAKAARSKENLQMERDEQASHDAREKEFRENQERLEREQRQKEKEEEEREQRRLERERARRADNERERARQAVERATREARERAAAEARLRAERAAVEKAQAEARERAERAAVQRAQAEARERAAAEARERAQRAAAEAKEKSNVEARERELQEKAEARRRAERNAVERAAAEARERAAVDARERAAAAARMNQVNQQKNENDLESFFSTRPSSVPKARASSSDPFFDTQFQGKGGPDLSKRSSSTTVPSSNIKKASSTANIVDDLSSIFGAPSSSVEFQAVEGESEERRRARLERHQRTQERAAKALAEKNQRDLQAQREQEERHRIGESLDFEIKRWSAGKEGNLRALLSTLQYVLWPECGWQPVSLTDLITGASVKKVYRKATLCIHPDKVQQKGATLQQKYIAEKVFDLLKEAWNKFNSEELF